MVFTAYKHRAAQPGMRGIYYPIYASVVTSWIRDTLVA